MQIYDADLGRCFHMEIEGDRRERGGSPNMLAMLIRGSAHELPPGDRRDRRSQPSDADVEPLEVLWRLRTERDVVWECVWLRSSAGFELRVSREGNGRDVIALRRFATVSEDIATYAAGWKRTGIAKGWKNL